MAPSKKIWKIAGIAVLAMVGLLMSYFLTLCFPQPFFKYHVTVGNITVYSDEEIPSEIEQILTSAAAKVQRSVIHKEGLKQNIFIANDPIRWAYFSNINHRAGGISYAYFVQNIFFRKVDIENNRLYGSSGKVAAGDRTLDYFIAHEMTHRLEYLSMPWYEYSIKENWVQEGYSEYIGHDSVDYETALKYYLEEPENARAKQYTKWRVMVAYLLEEEKIDISDIWDHTDDFDSILAKAIPDDRPNIVN